MRVVTDFILIVVKENRLVSECSERFRFNISEVKHDGECSQRFHFDNSDEENIIVSVVIDLILIVGKENRVAIAVRDFILIVLA